MTSGILLVDKPLGLTSHDVVARVRRIAGTRKVGHAGTLDPLASGVLVLGINSATRLLHYMVGLDKEYLATIRLGQSSSSDDAEGELSDVASSDQLEAVSDGAISREISQLTGSIAQVPSSVSAIKVDGQRAYARARAGEEVQLSPRDVTISRFDVLALRRGKSVDVDVRVECSSGTYIRALARDLGRALNVGGHLTALQRTRVGPFHLSQAHTLAELERDWPHPLVSMAQGASEVMPSITVSEAQVRDLRYGKRIVRLSEQPGENLPVAAISPSGRLVAIVESHADTWKVVAGFPEEEL